MAGERQEARDPSGEGDRAYAAASHTFGYTSYLMQHAVLLRQRHRCRSRTTPPLRDSRVTPINLTREYFYVTPTHVKRDLAQIKLEQSPAATMSERMTP
jgi:hypothetical protein